MSLRVKVPSAGDSTKRIAEGKGVHREVESEGSCSKELDARIRYRLRMCIWKQWKTPQNRIKNLMKLGVDKDTAWITAYTGSRIAYMCQRRVMNFAINKERLTKFGLVSMLDYYTERCVTC